MSPDKHMLRGSTSGLWLEGFEMELSHSVSGARLQNLIIQTAGLLGHSLHLLLGPIILK